MRVCWEFCFAVATCDWGGVYDERVFVHEVAEVLGHVRCWRVTVRIQDGILMVFFFAVLGSFRG